MSSNDSILNLIGRSKGIFDQDILEYEKEITAIIQESNFLVIGGAGSIGQAVSKEIFLRNPKKLHIVDISENNMVELVRDIRSSMGYIKGEFKTFALDCGSLEYEKMFKNEGPYDYVFNLSALKHVRSEKDPYTLYRLIQVNIINTIKTIQLAKEEGVKKYFCVSTDKAANPVNMMGASKRIMELFLIKESHDFSISTARFANVAFSDGSLLHGFNNRIEKLQPLSAPNDIKRYFVTAKESGQLCLLSGLLGENRDIFFPKLSEELHLITFSEIAELFLRSKNFEPYLCSTEEEARVNANKLINSGQWPCYFFKSDTTGEKDFEEFYTKDENINLNSFKGVGIVKNYSKFNNEELDNFLNELSSFSDSSKWQRSNIINLFNKLLPDFDHKETGKFLDQKM